MKVLIIRFSSIGDVLLTTPIIRCLSHQINAEVHFLTKEAYRDLLLDNPYLAKLYLLESTSVNILRREGYDEVIDLQGSLRSLKVKLALGFMVRSYRKERRKTNRFIATKNDKYQPTHVLSRYFEQVYHLGVKNDGIGLTLVSSQTSHEASEKPRIAIVTGGSTITKRLSPNLVGQICNLPDYHFVLIGGSDVTGIDINSTSKVSNYIGQLDLKSSISELSKAHIVITGDTGFMHIAAALNKPMIVVWGSTSPKMGFRPVYKDISKQYYGDISLDLPCQPCSKYGIKACPLHHMDCINKVHMSHIIGHLKEAFG